MDNNQKTLEAISTTLTLIYDTLQSIEARLEVRGPEGEQKHRAGRVELLLPSDALGFDEETPKDWLEKMRVIPRILAKLNLSISPGCWIYTGTMTQGQMLIYHPHTSKKVTLRRFMYEYLVGPLPDGYKTVKPDCNDLCVNPNHLKIPRMVREEAFGITKNQDFEQFMIGMEKNRKNVIFANGQKYLQFPAAHWDIVYRTENGHSIGANRFSEYLKMHQMYHYLDPIVSTPSRDPSVPTDLEWMTQQMGPRATEGQTAARVKSLAESLGLE